MHLFSVITAMTLTSRVITINNILNSEIHFTGGLIIIPVVFFIQDIVTESYGHIYSQKMLKVSLILYVLYVILNMALSNILYGESDEYLIMVNTLPRHTLSFIISLYISGTINNYILYKLKLFFNSRFLSIRFIVATIIGEFIFQIIAILISWYGIYNTSGLVKLSLIAYSYKILFEIVVTPINIVVCKYLKSLYTTN